MKTSLYNQRGITLIELLVVLAVVGLLAGMFLPALAGNKAPRGRIQCVSNLKQVGLGFRLYANDGEPYPAYDPTSAAWKYFQVVGKEIGSPKVLLCPEDKERKSAALDFEANGTTNNFSHPFFRNAALSFFYGPGASETQPNMILAGDRNVSTNAQMLTGLLDIVALGTNPPVRWTEDLHKKESGNIALADGSAQQVTSQRLREQIKIGFSTNGLQRFVLP